MISRRSLIGGLLVTPAIVRASSLMKLPRRPTVLGVYNPHIPLVVTSVVAHPRKLAAHWTFEPAQTLIIEPTPDSVVDEIARQLARELKGLI